jgi:ribose-phosphate pyrophosphokinase
MTPDVHTFADSEDIAGALAACLGARLVPVEVHRFPDGEGRVRVDTPDPERPAIVVRSLDRPDAKLVELLFTADALRRRGVSEITLVAPYLGYMRQDRSFREGEAVSQRVVGELLGSAFDRVLTVEAHLHRIATLDEVFPCRASSLSAAPLIAGWLRTQAGAVLVGPDVESAPWVTAISEASGLPAIVCAKERFGDRSVRIDVPAPPPGTHRAWIVDDVGSSGVTLQTAALGLRKLGIDEVGAVVVHALFEPGALERLRVGGVSRLLSTDTLPHATNALSVAPLLAEALVADGAVGSAA